MYQALVRRMNRIMDDIDKLLGKGMVDPSLSTSGETLTIEVSMNLEGENGERRNVGDEHEWSWAGG